MKNLMKFENKNVEVFEFNERILFNPYHVGKCLELSDSSVRKSIRNFNENQRIKLTKSIVTNSNNLDIPTSGRVYLTESGVYKLIFKSRKKEAERFCDWVTDEVLPSIRKTGKYENQPKEEYKIEPKTYKGKPVLVMRDLEYLFNKNINMLYEKYINTNLERNVLRDKELKLFIKENSNINKNIRQLAIYNKKEVIALCKELNVEIPSFIYEYFGKEEDFTPNENYNRYRQVMDCGELLKIANQSVIDEKYKQAIGIIVSNVLNDLGLYNNLDGDYSLNCANGWNKKSIIFDVSNLMKNGKNITAFERKKYRDSILLSIV